MLVNVFPSRRGCSGGGLETARGGLASIREELGGVALCSLGKKLKSG